MSAYPSRAQRLGLALLACVIQAACGTIDSVSYSIVGAVTPFRTEVVQGNFLSREQVALLKPGLTRQEVRDALGTPLVTSLFHTDRWDYVFTLRRQGVAPQTRRFTTYFKGDVLDRFEGDEMPTEAEFVATLDAKPRKPRVPVLEASEETLKQFASSSASGTVTAATLPPAPTSYPPLEAATGR